MAALCGFCGCGPPSEEVQERAIAAARKRERRLDYLQEDSEEDELLSNQTGWDPTHVEAYSQALLAKQSFEDKDWDWDIIRAAAAALCEDLGDSKVLFTGRFCPDWVTYMKNVNPFFFCGRHPLHPAARTPILLLVVWLMLCLPLFGFVFSVNQPYNTPGAEVATQGSCGGMASCLTGNFCNNGTVTTGGVLSSNQCEACPFVELECSGAALDSAAQSACIAACFPDPAVHALPPLSPPGICLVSTLEAALAAWLVYELCFAAASRQSCCRRSEPLEWSRAEKLCGGCSGFVVVLFCFALLPALLGPFLGPVARVLLLRLPGDLIRLALFAGPFPLSAFFLFAFATLLVSLVLQTLHFAMLFTMQWADGGTDAFNISFEDMQLVLFTSADESDEEAGGSGMRNLRRTIAGEDNAADRARRNRLAVVAESGWRPDPNFEPPVYQKTAQQRASLTQTLSRAFMFAELSQRDRDSVIDAFMDYPVQAGQQIITEGAEVGSSEPGLFILESGRVSVYRASDHVPPPGGKIVTFSSQGDVFGELALLHNAPRSGTVIADVASKLWSLDRDTFNACVKGAAARESARREGFLKTVEIFNQLKGNEISTLADTLHERSFSAGQKIISQGEQGQDMYIIVEGQVQASQSGSYLANLGPGEYFGELAIMKSSPRAADVIALTPCTCLTITKPEFDRLLGSLESLMHERAERKYTRQESQAAIRRQSLKGLSSR